MAPRPWAPLADREHILLERALREREPTERAMQAVSFALSDGETEESVVAECVEKLSEWIRRQTVTAQKLMLACRINAVVVQVMRKHGQDVEVARHCCRIIAGVASKHSQNSASLMKAGVILAITDVMDLHPGDAQVQENGTQALGALAERDGCREIIATGGVARLLRVMAAHPENTYIQRNAWRCLDCIISNGGELTGSMREEIIEAAELVNDTTGAIMRSNHPKDKATKRLAERLAKWVQTCVTEHKQQPKITLPTKVKDVPAITEEVKVEVEQLDLRVWLFGLDPSGTLEVYHTILAENFDSVVHVVDAYGQGDRLDPQFFEDVGVVKIGHRRKFEQWFTSHLAKNADSEPLIIIKDL